MPAQAEHVLLERFGEFFAGRLTIECIISSLVPSAVSLKAWSSIDGREHLKTKIHSLDGFYAAYENGDVVIADHVSDHQELLPILTEALAWYRANVGGATGCNANAVFAKASGVVIPHFDRDPILSLQVRGSKRWYVEPNTQLNSTPVAGWFDFPERERLLQQSREDKLEPPTPCAMSYSYDLGPGDAIFLPPGVWHCTQAKSASCSLTLAMLGVEGG